MARVLVIADDGPLARILVTALLSRGHSASATILGSEALKAVSDQGPDTVVLQLPPGAVGRAYLTRFSTTEFRGSLLVISSEESLFQEHFEREVRLLRPWQLQEILAAII